MSDALSIGVVGTGSLGQRGALDHLVLPDVTDRIRVGAVCDTAPGRAQAAADAYDIDRFHDNYDSLLRDGDVEAVTLCTPIGLHYEQGLKAIRAGKHVHFNKTMATTAAEATILIDAAEAEGVRIVASPGQMAQPQNRLSRVW
jgi:predicted dehydrogenase